jgi:riboflavin kinase/FMN adenylyltransferase
VTIWRGLGEVPRGTTSVATIGVFDGVHRGHQALMRATAEAAGRRGVQPVAVTFDRHPLDVIAPERAPRALSTLEQRARWMHECGIDAVLVLTFDDTFRHRTPEEFIRRVIVDTLGCAEVIVGANFRFGYKQAGTIETLQDLGARDDFEVTVVGLQTDGDETLSSNLIRQHLREGLVERAATELGHPYALAGVVEHGAKRGRDLGFPTANLRPAERALLPRLGVYAGTMRWAGAVHPCVVNVGMNPTFGDRDTPIVEAFVIGLDADLYGEYVEIEFKHRLRDELRFDSVDALVKQMHDDVARARELLDA